MVQLVIYTRLYKHFILHGASMQIGRLLCKHLSLYEQRLLSPSYPQ